MGTAPTTSSSERRSPSGTGRTRKTRLHGRAPSPSTLPAPTCIRSILATRASRSTSAAKRAPRRAVHLRVPLDNEVPRRRRPELFFPQSPLEASSEDDLEARDAVHVGL